MNTIDDFVDRLIAEKGYDTKDPEIVAQIKHDLLRSVEETIDAMVLSNIPENDLAEFEKILDSNDQATITDYVKSKIPDLAQKTAATLLSFKNSYLM